MAEYYLRNIDDGLWKRVKARATSEGRNVRVVLIALLRCYARYGWEIVETFSRAKNGGH